MREGAFGLVGIGVEGLEDTGVVLGGVARDAAGLGCADVVVKSKSGSGSCGGWGVAFFRLAGLTYT